MVSANNAVRASAARGAAILAVFESAVRAEGTVDELHRAGFNTSSLSVIGKDEFTAAHQLGFAAAGAQMRFWGRRGALWTRLCSDPPGVAIAWVPFVGHVVAVGPVACVLVGNRWEESFGPGATALSKMLTLAGMSAGEAQSYEAAVRGGQILLLMHGVVKDVARARGLLHSTVASNAP